MIRRTTFAIVIATGLLAGCKSNPPEQVAAAHQAAEAYCACVKPLFGIPGDQLADQLAALPRSPPPAGTAPAAGRRAWRRRS